MGLSRSSSLVLAYLMIDPREHDAGGRSEGGRCQQKRLPQQRLPGATERAGPEVALWGVELEAKQTQLRIKTPMHLEFSIPGIYGGFSSSAPLDMIKTHAIKWGPSCGFTLCHFNSHSYPIHSSIKCSCFIIVWFMVNLAKAFHMWWTDFSADCPQTGCSHVKQKPSLVSVTDVWGINSSQLTWLASSAVPPLPLKLQLCFKGWSTVKGED